MAYYISKLKWAWQAQFLSHILVRLKNSVFFEDKQMILVSFFDIFAGFRFQKNLKSLPIQFLRYPWSSQSNLSSLFLTKSLVLAIEIALVLET